MMRVSGASLRRLRDLTEAAAVGRSATERGLGCKHSPVHHPVLLPGRRGYTRSIMRTTPSLMHRLPQRIDVLLGVIQRHSAVLGAQHEKQGRFDLHGGKWTNGAIASSKPCSCCTHPRHPA